MGRSADAILAYGYPLGGHNNGWLIEQINEYGGLDPDRMPDWYADGEVHDGFTEQAEARLRAVVADFTETDWKVAGYYKRKQAADKQVGVEFRHHGYEFGEAMLVAYSTSVEWGDTRLLDFTELERLRVDGDWDSKLAAAIAALGITPTQERPGWLLAAYYG